MEYIFSSHQDTFQDFLNILKQKKLHHGIILSGNKGIGKLFFAKHLAKVILSYNIEDFSKIDEANIDETVANLIDKNSHPNLLFVQPEFDEKKQLLKEVISVDKIKQINEFLYKSFDEDKYKIIIINTLDNLNINASNSLLKSLEEPSKNTLFLLLSHNYLSLLDTIKSRCINFKLKPLKELDVRSLLEGRNIKKEYEEDIIKIVAGSYNNILWYNDDTNFKIFEDLYNIANNEVNDIDIINFVNFIKNSKEDNFDMILEIIKFYVIKKISLININNYNNLLAEIYDISKKAKSLYLDKNTVILNILFKLKKYEKL